MCKNITLHSIKKETKEQLEMKRTEQEESLDLLQETDSNIILHLLNYKYVDFIRCSKLDYLELVDLLNTALKEKINLNEKILNILIKSPFFRNYKNTNCDKREKILKMFVEYIDTNYNLNNLYNVTYKTNNIYLEINNYKKISLFYLRKRILEENHKNKIAEYYKLKFIGFIKEIFFIHKINIPDIDFDKLCVKFVETCMSFDNYVDYRTKHYSERCILDRTAFFLNYNNISFLKKNKKYLILLNEKFLFQFDEKFISFLLGNEDIEFRQIKKSRNYLKEDRLNFKIFKSINLKIKDLFDFNFRFEVDHVFPFSKGGTHHFSNLQILIKKHNRRKYDNINGKRFETYEFQRDYIIQQIEKVYFIDENKRKELFEILEVLKMYF